MSGLFCQVAERITEMAEKREHGLERRERGADHELTVVMMQTTGCREKHTLTIRHLHTWLRHLNRAGHLLLSDLEHEIDKGLTESDWLWSALDGTLAASRQIMEIQYQVEARGDHYAVAGNTYELLGMDVLLEALQEILSKTKVLIPESRRLAPTAYGEG